MEVPRPVLMDLGPPGPYQLDPPVASYRLPPGKTRLRFQFVEGTVRFLQESPQAKYVLNVDVFDPAMAGLSGSDNMGALIRALPACQTYVIVPNSLERCIQWLTDIDTHLRENPVTEFDTLRTMLLDDISEAAFNASRAPQLLASICTRVFLFDANSRGFAPTGCEVGLEPRDATTWLLIAVVTPALAQSLKKNYSLKSMMLRFKRGFSQYAEIAEAIRECPADLTHATLTFEAQDPEAYRVVEAVFSRKLLTSIFIQGRIADVSANVPLNLALEGREYRVKLNLPPFYQAQTLDAMRSPATSALIKGVHLHYTGVDAKECAGLVLKCPELHSLDAEFKCAPDSPKSALEGSALLAAVCHRLKGGSLVIKIKGLTYEGVRANLVRSVNQLLKENRTAGLTLISPDSATCGQVDELGMSMIRTMIDYNTTMEDFDLTPLTKGKDRADGAVVNIQQAIGLRNKVLCLRDIRRMFLWWVLANFEDHPQLRMPVLARLLNLSEFTFIRGMEGVLRFFEYKVTVHLAQILGVASPNRPQDMFDLDV